MKQKQQTLIKSDDKLRKQGLQQQLKQIIDQIKQTYFQFLSSLKFQNINDKQSYKQTMKSHRTYDKQHNILQQSTYDVDKSYSNFNDNNQHIHSTNKQSISQLELKTFSFQQELAVQNKGYLAFVRLINNIKQLQDYNHFLRSIVMSSDTQGHLQKYQNQLLQDLKKLQVDIPACYFMKKN